MLSQFAPTLHIRCDRLSLTLVVGGGRLGAIAIVRDSKLEPAKQLGIQHLELVGSVRSCTHHEATSLPTVKVAFAFDAGETTNPLGSADGLYVPRDIGFCVVHLPDLVR